MAPPEQTLLYRTVAENFETWFELASACQFDGQGDHHTPPAHVKQAFRKYLECGIFAHGFARARCDDCGHDFTRQADWMPPSWPRCKPLPAPGSCAPLWAGPDREL